MDTSTFSYGNTSTFSLMKTSSSNNDSSLSNLSLSEINDARAEELIPAMAVIGLYILIGGVGNSLVIYVIGFKLKMNTQNLLIVWLAVIDLLCCLVSIPTDIVDMRFSYMFPSKVMCKILRLVMHFTSIGSGLILIVIAIDRFRKICQPLKCQMGINHAKIAMAIVLFIDIALSWPTLVIFGYRDIETNVPGIWGYDCSTSEAVKDTAFPLAYALFLFLFLLTCWVLLMVLYCYILISTKRFRRRMMSKSVLATQSLRAKKTSGTIPRDNSASSNSDSSQDQSKIKDSLRINSSTKSLLCLEKDEDKTGGLFAKRPFQRPKLPSSYSLTDRKEDDGIGESVEMKECKLISVQNRQSTYSSDSDKVFDSENLVTDNKLLKSQSIGHYSTLHGFYKQEQAVIGKQEDSGVGSDPEDPEQMVTPTFNDTTHQEEQSGAKNKQQISTVFVQRVEREPEEQKYNHMMTPWKMEQKTTLIAFLVTLVFILSYLPYSCMQIAKVAVQGFDYERKGADLIFYNIFLRSYYINSIANPIIYSLLNIKFREEVQSLFLRLWQGLSNVCRK